MFRLIQNEERVVPSFKTTLTSNNERFNKIQDELLVGISLHQSDGHPEWVSLRILFFTGECLTLTADITFVVCVCSVGSNLYETTCGCMHILPGSCLE